MNCLTRINRTWPLAALILTLILSFQGCAGPNRLGENLARERPVDSAHFFETLDAVVDDHNVKDVSAFAVPNYPYLRTNRFLESVKDSLRSENQFAAWLDWMMVLDQEGRRKEIYNLPDDALELLKKDPGGFDDRAQLLGLAARHAAHMRQVDGHRSEFYSELKSAVAVPDTYSTPMRIFGLYPIVAIPVAIATANAYKEFRQWHGASLDELEIQGQVIVFSPQTAGGAAAAQVTELFRSKRYNALGVVELSAAEAHFLARAFAPIIAQDVMADYDRLGAVAWTEGKVTIDPQRPTVYYYITYSILNQKPVLQLNYAFWYTERSGDKAPGIEKGPLDGVTFRISLDTTGQPVMADVMNNCGCYYFYIPRRETIKDIHPSSDKLYPFVPTYLPDAFPQERISLRINSGWHQVEHVYTGPPPENAREYQLLPYEMLESLPHPDGTMESVFTPKGIMKDSKRIEPYIFFSMGIPKVGYMRQRSHHAIKLVGRSHFTDTDIYDRYFVFE